MHIFVYLYLFKFLFLQKTIPTSSWMHIKFRQFQYAEPFLLRPRSRSEMEWMEKMEEMTSSVVKGKCIFFSIVGNLHLCKYWQSDNFLSWFNPSFTVIVPWSTLFFPWTFLLLSPLILFIFTIPIHQVSLEGDVGHYMRVLFFVIFLAPVVICLCLMLRVKMAMMVMTMMIESMASLIMMMMVFNCAGLVWSLRHPDEAGWSWLDRQPGWLGRPTNS